MGKSSVASFLTSSWANLTIEGRAQGWAGEESHECTVFAKLSTQDCGSVADAWLCSLTLFANPKPEAILRGRHGMLSWPSTTEQRAEAHSLQPCGRRVSFPVDGGKGAVCCNAMPQPRASCSRERGGASESPSLAEASVLRAMRRQNPGRSQKRKP